MRLGFIGYGEAAFEMSCGLYQEGLRETIAYDPLWDHPDFKQLIHDRAKQANVQLLPTAKDVVQKANVLIVAVPADQAKHVSESIAPYLTTDHLYIDVSASTPEIKQHIAGVVAHKNGLFVDAAMMGSLPAYKHQVPILASGTGTDQFIQLMTPYHMNIEKVSDTAGDASATKLIRSIFMKGIAALLIEMLEAATHFKVDDRVIASVTETMNKDSFDTILNRLVTGTSIHSKRRAFELEGSLSMLDHAGLSSLMTKAAKEKLEQLTDYHLNDHFNGQTPDSWKEVIHQLAQKRS